MIKEYIINLVVVIIIAVISLYLIKKLLRIKLIGGKILPFAAAVAGALLGTYFFPLLNNIHIINIDIPSAFSGAILVLFFLHLVSPISFKS